MLQRLTVRLIILSLTAAIPLLGCTKKDDDDEPAETPTLPSAVGQPDSGGDSGGDVEAPCDPTALCRGDVLVLREESGGGVGGNGEILAFSRDGGYKFLAYDSAGVVPWYGYGLRLSYDETSVAYHVEAGSSNASLAISVRTFEPMTVYPAMLGDWTEGPASDAAYFQGAFSEELAGVRHVAVGDGANVDVYVSGSVVASCRIAMPSGKYARAIHSGIDSTASGPLVAYTLGSGTSVTGYGVARLSGAACKSASGTPQTLTTVFEDTAFPDAKIASVMEVRGKAGGSDSWAGDIFVTVGPFLQGPQVRRWHLSSTWADAGVPSDLETRAVFQDGEGDLYTLEFDDDVGYINRYTVDGAGGSHFVETVHTDETGEHLVNVSLAQWLVVMPDL